MAAVAPSEAGHHREKQRTPHQRQRGGQTLFDEVDDRPVSVDGVAEVALHRLPEPAQILHRQRVVQAQILPNAGDVLRRALREPTGHVHLHRVSRRRAHDRERQDGDHQERRDDEQHPAQQDLIHLAPNDEPRRVAIARRWAAVPGIAAGSPAALGTACRAPPGNVRSGSLHANGIDLAATRRDRGSSTSGSTSPSTARGRYRRCPCRPSRRAG